MFFLRLRNSYRKQSKDYKQNKTRAKEIVIEIISRINQNNKFKYGKISIRNQKTRWGSCSTKGNLNFNYRIVYLPPDLQEYLVAHELCHLIEFNHSKKFWALVETLIPDYMAKSIKLRGWSMGVGIDR